MAELQGQRVEEDRPVPPAERPGPDTWAASQLLEAVPSLVTRGIVYLTVAVLVVGVAWAAVIPLDTVVRCPAVIQGDEAGLVAELKLPSREVGRVEPGVALSLQVDAYPAVQFGVVRTEVALVAPAAHEDPQLGWVYPVTARVPRAWLEAHGRRFPLRPGMTATAEIVVGRRTLLGSILGGGG